MIILGNALAAGGFVYAGILMVSCMAKSVREVLNPQVKGKKHKGKKRHAARVKVKSKLG